MILNKFDSKGKILKKISVFWENIVKSVKIFNRFFLAAGGGGSTGPPPKRTRPLGMKVFLRAPLLKRISIFNLTQLNVRCIE